MFERALVQKLVDRMNEPRRFIQMVVGPRQTGKTTAVYQALSHLNQPTRFVSADEPSILTADWLKGEWSQARLLAQDSEDGAILVIDEIQKMPQWSTTVKFLWDEDARLGTNLRVILTGSSALLLRKGMKESLMGRFEVLRSTHWIYEECREAFGYTLDEFLYFGGYPGSAELRVDPVRWMQYMGDSIVEPTISQDILQMEEIRKPALMRALFMLGATYSGQELSYTKILGQLQDAGNTVTLAHYLALLGSAGLLTGLGKFSHELVRARKSSPRFMVEDTSLMVYASGTTREKLDQDSTWRGHLVESAVGAYLLTRAQEERFEVYYWRDRNHEVDFVIRKGNALTAIEVKSGRIKGVGGGLEFMKRNPEALVHIVGSPHLPLEDFLLGRVRLFK